MNIVDSKFMCVFNLINAATIKENGTNLETCSRAEIFIGHQLRVKEYMSYDMEWKKFLCIKMLNLMIMCFISI